MSEAQQSDQGGQPGKTRTWWHPLLVRLLSHELGTAYTVLDEVPVGKMPLRVDILLIQREDGRLSEFAESELSSLVPLLNRFTLIEFKGPTDTLERGDFAQLLGCSFLWHSQQTAEVICSDVTLIVLAPILNEAFRNDLRLLNSRLDQDGQGVFEITGLPFIAWGVETDVMTERGEPVLSLVSRAFLRERRRIMESLERTGHTSLLQYVLQQVQQFRKLGEDFAMQHKDSQLLETVEDDIVVSILRESPADKIRKFVREGDVLQAIPAEDIVERLTAEERLRGMPAEERLRGMPAEERLRGMSPEEVVDGLSEEALARLREFLDRKRGH